MKARKVYIIFILSLMVWSCSKPDPMKDEKTSFFYHRLIQSMGKSANILTQLDSIDIDKKLILFLEGIEMNIIGDDRILFNVKRDVEHLKDEINTYSDYKLSYFYKEKSSKPHNVYFSIPYFTADSSVALIYRFEQFISQSGQPNEINEFISLYKQKDNEWSVFYHQLLN